MKLKLSFLALLCLLAGFIFWLNIQPVQGKALPASGADENLDAGPERQTALAESLTRLDQYFYPPTATGIPYHYAMKTQLWCERADQDSLTYREKLVCGLTPQPNEPRWPRQTEAFLEQCSWQGGRASSQCPVTPLKSPNPYEYTVTPEPLS